MHQIIIKGHLDEKWNNWFDGLNITYNGKNTILSGQMKDSSHLHGILNKIRDFNLTLISVNPIDKKNNHKKENIMKNLGLSILICFMSFTLAFGQNTTEEKELKHRRSIGGSVFMAVSYFDPEPADYVLINYGYQTTPKSKIFVEAFTWKYPEPMGTYGNSEEMYPGEIRAFGIGVGYQRLLWKNLFAQINATPMVKQYNDEDGDKIQNGFLLYMQLGLGYKFEFFKDRWFLEPAWFLKYWPIDTNFPKAFARIEKGAPIHIWEPSLNFGFNF